MTTYIDKLRIYMNKDCKSALSFEKKQVELIFLLRGLGYCEPFNTITALGLLWDPAEK